MHPLSATVWISPDRSILLGKQPIKEVKEAKFLALIFDTKLTFKKHVHCLKSSCQKAVNVVLAVGHTDWGAQCIVRCINPFQTGLRMCCLMLFHYYKLYIYMYDHPMLVKILEQYMELTKDWKEIAFTWVPGH